MKNDMFTLLYIGNKLKKHGKTPSSIDTLTPQLRTMCNVIAVSEKLNLLTRMFDIIVSIIKNRNKLDAILIDTYSSLNFYIAVIASFLAQKFKIDYYLYLHGGNLPMRLQKNPKLSSFLFKGAKNNISPSGYLQDAFMKEGYVTEFIPNNIDISIYPFKQRCEVFPKILYVRAFSKIYNPQMAIKAFYEIYLKFPKAVMCMVGPDKDGTLQLCKELSKKLGVEHAIEFTGKLEKKEWINKSKEYDIFINPTNFDNQPVSILEAMALGFPIVSTNAGGLPYLIKDKDEGLLVEKNDVQAFSEAIFNLLEDENLSSKLSLKSREKAVTYDWNSVSLKWKKLFNIMEVEDELS